MNNQENPPALPSLLTTPRRAARRVTDADVAKLPQDANFEVDGVDMGAFDPAPTPAPALPVAPWLDRVAANDAMLRRAMDRMALTSMRMGMI